MLHPKSDGNTPKVKPMTLKDMNKSNVDDFSIQDRLDASTIPSSASSQKLSSGKLNRLVLSIRIKY
jgi:hypothetical protein